MAFVAMLLRGKDYNRMNKAAVERHVGNIRQLDDAGKLQLCGAFKGYPGVAGMYVLEVATKEEAEAICQNEPLVAEGFATYKVYEIMLANRENNYLM